MKLKQILIIGVATLTLSACVSVGNNPTVTPSPQPSASPTVSLDEYSTASATNVDKTAAKEKGKKNMTATLISIKTAKGVIEIELYPQDAPKTVENFATLTSQGYYNGLTFHRVEPGFVIQGGDPNGNGTGGKSVFGDTFEDELNPETASYKNGYKEGVVAMANRGPNTNGSQFFIMLEETPLPHAYTIFGKVVKGMDVVKQIVVGDKMVEVKIVK